MGDSYWDHSSEGVVAIWINLRGVVGGEGEGWKFGKVRKDVVNQRRWWRSGKVMMKKPLANVVLYSAKHTVNPTCEGRRVCHFEHIVPQRSIVAHCEPVGADCSQKGAAVATECVGVAATLGATLPPVTQKGPSRTVAPSFSIQLYFVVVYFSNTVVRRVRRRRNLAEL